MSGSLAGQIWMADDFDEPDEVLIDLFYNGATFPDGENSPHENDKQ